MSLFSSCLILDSLAASKSKRYNTRDVIGSGPRWIAGVVGKYMDCNISRAEDFLRRPSEHDLYMISAMSTDYPVVRKILSKLLLNGVTSSGESLNRNRTFLVSPAAIFNK